MIPMVAMGGQGTEATEAVLDADPYAVLAELRATRPVAWLDAVGGWLVTRRDLALEVMRDAGRFSVDDPRFTTAQVVGPSMLSLDGPEHARHRAPWVAPLRLGAVRAELGEVVREEAGARVAALAPAGLAELRRGFAGPLAAAVVGRTLGLPAGATDAVLPWYDAIVSAVTDLSAGRPAGPEAAEAVAALAAALAPVRGEAGAGLGEAEYASNAAVVLFGGIETMEGMIGNALVHLLRHPPALARVRADPGLLPAAVEESLRLEPAAAAVDRYAAADAELGGVRIVRGDLVRVSVTAANRDPAAFAAPDAFDLDRPNAGRHLAFASGPHVCVGMHLARLEAHVALRALLDGLPGLRLAADRPPPEIRGLIFRKPRTLWAAWDVPTPRSGTPRAASRRPGAARGSAG